MAKPLDSRLHQYFQDAAAVTPTDGTVLSRPAAALWVGTAGPVAIITPGGTTLTFLAVPAGVFPVACKNVNSTGTTATGLIALWTTDA